MRVGVIRGDIPGPLFLADLEPSSQTNFPTEPEGQTRYISRPTVVTVGNMMSAAIPASIAGGAVAFPVTVVAAASDHLKAKDSAAAPFTTYTIPAGVYADMAALVTAINSVLVASPFVAVGVAGGALALQTKAFGSGSYIAIGSVVGGSTFNSLVGWNAAGASFTVPAASAFIAAVSPVGGPIDVSAATLRTQLGAGLTDAQIEAAADSIAPRFVETDVAVKSFLVGDLAGYLSSSYSPDPNRIPVIAPGPAVEVWSDDGTAAFTASAPTITNAQINVPAPGAVRITGLGMASFGIPNAEQVATKVKFLLAVPVSVDQAFIVAAGGVVNETSITIPASLVPAGVKAGVKVQVQYTSLVSNQFTIV